VNFHLKTWSVLSGLTLSLALVAGCSSEEAAPENNPPLAAEETSNIAYNTPETIQLDDTAVVQLKLSPSFGIDELKKKITELGKKEGASIPIPFYRRVVAHLKGLAFKIEALGEEIPREVKPGRVCEWERCSRV
jgi:hypothetical protein